ncbi:MAG: patatin-like phospholipase family protein, partial [Woeseiaceae bacterium]
LVLGGGGARGAAHIGVLQELERLRVPVDAIAGTSMGAIVGGLYASGVNADDLDNIVRSLNWSEAMSDEPRRNNLSFRRKQDDRRYPINLELGLQGGNVVLPKGLVQGQNLELLLRHLTARADHIDNFDELPIPFRAVATDIETGDVHVMSGGDLAMSIRASMSVPGLLAPTELDGKLLVDGGVVANLPIDIIRAMDVDIIIAVEVDFPLYEPEELNSAPAITEQMLTILMRKNTLLQVESMGDNDVLIRPALGTFSSSDFGNAAFAVEKGHEAIDDVEDRLAELSLSESKYASHVAGRQLIEHDADRLEFVRIEHDGTLATELMQARVGVDVGDPIDTERLARGANRLYGLNMFEKVSYKIVDEADQVGVVYSATGKSWGPDFLNVGVTLQDDFDGTTAFNLAARLTRTGLNKHGAEWRTDVQLGTDLLLESEFYQPFGKGLKYFVAPRFDWHQNNQNIFVDDQNTAQLRVAETAIGVDLGAELGSYGEFRTGVYVGEGKSRIKIGDPLIPDNRYDIGGLFAQVQIDTFDQARFPRSGLGGNLRWDSSRTSLGAATNYDKLTFDILSAWSRGKNTLSAGVNYVTTFDTNDQLHEFTPMGGFLRLSGFDVGQISGPHAALGRLIYYRRLGETSNGLFDVPFYIGASAEYGNVWQDQSDIDIGDMLLNGSLFAAFDTYFGAIYFAAGFAEGGEQAFYFSIGSRPR